MLLLFETPAGYSLFKVKDEEKLKDVEVRLERPRLFVHSRWGIGDVFFFSLFFRCASLFGPFDGTAASRARTRTGQQ